MECHPDHLQQPGNCNAEAIQIPNFGISQTPDTREMTPNINPHCHYPHDPTDSSERPLNLESTEGPVFFQLKRLARRYTLNKATDVPNHIQIIHTNMNCNSSSQRKNNTTKLSALDSLQRARHRAIQRQTVNAGSQPCHLKHLGQSLLSHPTISRNS